MSSPFDSSRGQPFNSNNSDARGVKGVLNPEKGEPIDQILSAGQGVGAKLE